MQRRLLQATITTVVMAILLIGVPTAIMSALMVKNGIEADLKWRTSAVARSVERQVAINALVTEGMLDRG